VWSHDGAQVAFMSTRTGIYHIYSKPASGAGDDTLVLESPYTKVPQDWSRDFLLYYEVSPGTGRDLKAIDTRSKDRTPRVVANTPFEETLGQFSPDGRWVAYQTNESTRFEIVVQAFPEPNGKWQVSVNGGVEPRWRADSKAIYFIAPDGHLMSATVTAAGATFDASTPVALFPTRIVGGGVVATNRPQYAVRGGQFLVNQLVAEATVSPITLILNWSPEHSR
jgi:Tol biopolymer transport system component